EFKKFKSAMITKRLYVERKADHDKDKYDKWLSDEEMFLCFQWFVRDYGSPLTNDVEIIRSDFMNKVETVYNYVMNGFETANPSLTAFDVHEFLMHMTTMLEKRFIIFLINFKKQHWVTFVYCNPWFTIASNIKKKGGSSVPTAIENMDSYIHGWLMYDPMKGFLEEAKMKASAKKRRDMLNWFLNMASLYLESHYENTLKHLDWRMHMYLRHNTRDHWIKKFNDSEEFKTVMEENLEKIQQLSGNMKTAQLQTIIKWFIHGLEGPFGVVSGIQTSNLARLGFDNRLTEKIPYMIVPPAERLCIVQNDSNNCGVCCVLFLRDFLATQVSQTWKVPSGDMFQSMCQNLGSTLLLEKYYKVLPNLPSNFNLQAHLKLIFNLFREEFLLLLERLRLLHLGMEGTTFSAETLGDFGEASERLLEMKKHLMPFIPTVGNSTHYNTVLRVINDINDDKKQELVFDASNFTVIQKTQDFVTLSPTIINRNLSSAYVNEEELNISICSVYGFGASTNTDVTYAQGSPVIYEVYSGDTQDINLNQHVDSNVVEGAERSPVVQVVD
ncbi:MAG TPA: hypothetical protein VIQ31_25795, partial [Phormidium sp.]